MIVDLGGVGHYKNSTLTINIDPEAGADITCDITAGADALKNFLEPESVDLFTCIHVIEHLEPHEALRSMGYWRQFLKPGGQLFVVTPDMEKIAKDFVAGIIPFDVMVSIVFRDSPYSIAPAWSNHKWAWSYYTLRRDMAAAGYIVVDPIKSFGVPDYWLYDYKEFTFTNQVGKYKVPNLKVVGFK